MSKIKYFFSEEISAFFKTLKKERNVRDILFFHFIYRFGLRLNEGLLIKLEDVSAFEIKIKRLKGGQGRHYPSANDDSKYYLAGLKDVHYSKIVFIILIYL